MLYTPGAIGYKDGLWQGEDEAHFVQMTDAVLQRHRRIYFELLGLPPQTQTELEAEVLRVAQQQYVAFQQLRKVPFWLPCDDPDVTIYEKRGGLVWRPRR